MWFVDKTSNYFSGIFNYCQLIWRILSIKGKGIVTSIFFQSVKIGFHTSASTTKCTYYNNNMFLWKFVSLVVIWEIHYWRVQQTDTRPTFGDLSEPTPAFLFSEHSCRDLYTIKDYFIRYSILINISLEHFFSMLFYWMCPLNAKHEK